MQCNRRQTLQAMLAMGAAAGPLLSWPSRLAAEMKARHSERRLIVLWMPGGPSQMDTFDLKPGHSNGGPFQELQTSVPGMRFSEHLPELAKLAEHLAIVRGMQTKEGDHSRGTYLVRTGQRPGNPLRYPAVPAALAKELSVSNASIPGYVSILPNSFINPPAFSARLLGGRPRAAHGRQHGQLRPDHCRLRQHDRSRQAGRPTSRQSTAAGRLGC
ncbi:MAG: DUF1501 domain-containing protein [Pirellulaceae bacterium]